MEKHNSRMAVARSLLLLIHFLVVRTSFDCHRHMMRWRLSSTMHTVVIQCEMQAVEEKMKMWIRVQNSANCQREWDRRPMYTSNIPSLIHVGDKSKLKCILYHVIRIGQSQEENDKRRWGFPQPNAIIEFFARCHHESWNILKCDKWEDEREEKVVCYQMEEAKRKTTKSARKSPHKLFMLSFTRWSW